MAIKGKSKPKARRSVTPGPRPVYVPVTRPLVQRRGFQLGVLAVVVVAAAGAIAYGYVHERNQSHQRAQQRMMNTVSTTFDLQIRTAIGRVGEIKPPSGFTLLPGLKPQIDALRSGSADPSKVATNAKALAAQAIAGADALAKIDPAAMVSGKGIENAAYVRDLINSRFKMENALRMEAIAADLVRQAATATGPQVKALLDEADKARTTAETVFDSGFADWTNAQYVAGTFHATGPSAAGS